MESLFGVCAPNRLFSIICLTFGVGVHYNKRGTSLGESYLAAAFFPREGVSEMSEIGAILFLVVATGYILAITQKK